MKATHEYIRVSLEPRCTDALLIRKSVQDALLDMFGVTFAGTRIDVLSVNELGSETVMRVHPEDAPKIMAAMAGGSIKCSVVKTSSFLPALAS